MSFFKRILSGAKEDERPTIDPIADLVVEKLRVGYLVDYDMRTWQVTDHQLYRFNDGRTAEEWELTEGREKAYLEVSRGDDGHSWSLSKTIPIGSLGGGTPSHGVREHVVEYEDPPHEIDWQEKRYFLEGSVGGSMTPFSGGIAKQFVVWEFVDEGDESFVSIQQWGEREVTAASGFYVEDYQFSNILPGGDEV